MQSITIDKNQAGQRFDKFLHKYLPNASTGFLYKMLRKKNITLNGRKADGNEILSVGDVVCSFFSEETFEKFSSVKSDIQKAVNSEYKKAFNIIKNVNIVFEDEDILILDKPAGVLTQKAENNDVSLNEWLIGYLISKGLITEDELKTFRPSVCNRLDRNTSGIVLCGKSLTGSQFLSEMIKDRTVHKFYRTICLGQINKDIMLEGYLSKDSVKNKVTIKDRSFCPKGKSDYIKTAFHPLRVTNAYTYLEVELFTGKPHQIRAHLAGMGCPVIGDYKYGNTAVNNDLKKEFALNFQLLHAYRIEFPDEIPAKYRDTFGHLAGQKFIADLPAQFRSILEKI